MLSYRIHRAAILVTLGMSLTFTTTMAGGEDGIDVSHWQGSIDWTKVKQAGISFAVAKATEGDTYQDPTYLTNCQGIKDNNIKSGAYHYLIGNVTAQAQVTNVLGVMERCRPDVLVIDVEESRNEDFSASQMADVLHGVLEGLQSSFPDVYIYTGPNYWENKVDWKKYDFSQHKLWIAHYTTSPAPTIPTTWQGTGYTWWQYSNTGSVDGITGAVDLDRAKQ